MNDEDIFAEII